MMHNSGASAGPQNVHTIHDFGYSLSAIRIIIAFVVVRVVFAIKIVIAVVDVVVVTTFIDYSMCHGA